MEEKLSDPQCSNIIRTKVEHGQNDEGGESAAESHRVGLETPSNSRSEAISSSWQSQPPAVEADRTSSGSDCKQPDTGDYISLESSPKVESSPYFLKGRKECSSLKCEVEPVVDNVVANPVSSCVRESKGDQLSSKQNHTEVAHIESVLKMLDCGTGSVASRGIEKVWQLLSVWLDLDCNFHEEALSAITICFVFLFICECINALRCTMKVC